MRNDIPREHPFNNRNGTFTVGDQNLEEMLEFLEDMIMLAGCPVCSSLNTRMIVMDTARVMLCLDCGTIEKLPKPN
jgi:hypothetical protein